MNMDAIILQTRTNKTVAKPTLARSVDHRGRAIRAQHADVNEMAPWALSVNELRETRREVQRLSNELLAVQENERKRIAADLHDGIGQSLSLLKLSAKAAMEHLEADSPNEAAQALAGLDARIQDVLTELRRVCLDLRPSMLDDLGILPTLSWLLRDVEEAGSGLAIGKVVTVEEADVPEQLKIVVFRIVQEALCNIAKHADASRVRVVFLRTENDLRLVIEDNGAGFDPSTVADRSRTGRGLGVRGMKERARLSGGDYTLESAPGKGTRIQVSWPLEANEPNWAEASLAA